MATSFWHLVEDWSYNIFYQRPLRMHRHRGLEHHHLDTMYTCIRVLAITYFLLPWVFLAVWYLAVAHGCGSHASRPYVEAFCSPPHSSLGNGTHWYVDLWDAGNTHSSVIPSRYTETIMSSHLDIEDAGIALRHQVSKLKAIPSEIIKADELLSSLGMLRVSAISM